MVSPSLVPDTSVCLPLAKSLLLPGVSVCVAPISVDERTVKVVCSVNNRKEL